METKTLKFSDVKASAIGLLPITKGRYYSFTPDAFSALPEAYRPIFKIGQYNNGQVERIRELMNSTKKKNDSETNAAYMQLLFEVFGGWENLYDLATEELIAWDNTMDGDRGMTLLPQNILMTIFSESLVLCGIIPKELSKQLTKQFENVE